MRRGLVLTAIVVACVASAAALAADGYSAHVRTVLSVAAGQPFTVKSNGAAAQKALLYVYLDHKSCKSAVPTT